MKIIKGIKIGGLQQKIFNLMLIFILLLVGAYVAVSVWQQRSLTNIVQESGARQQESITAVSGDDGGGSERLHDPEHGPAGLHRR